MVAKSLHNTTRVLKRLRLAMWVVLFSIPILIKGLLSNTRHSLGLPSYSTVIMWMQKWKNSSSQITRVMMTTMILIASSPMRPYRFQLRSNRVGWLNHPLRLEKQKGEAMKSSPLPLTDKIILSHYSVIEAMSKKLVSMWIELTRWVKVKRMSPSKKINFSKMWRTRMDYCHVTRQCKTRWLSTWQLGDQRRRHLYAPQKKIVKWKCLLSLWIRKTILPQFIRLRVNKTKLW